MPICSAKWEVGEVHCLPRWASGAMSKPLVLPSDANLVAYRICSSYHSHSRGYLAGKNAHELALLCIQSSRRPDKSERNPTHPSQLRRPKTWLALHLHASHSPGPNHLVHRTRPARDGRHLLNLSPQRVPVSDQDCGPDPKT